MILRALLAFGYALSWVPIHVYRVEEYGKALGSYGPGERRMSRLTPASITLHVALACVLLSLAEPPGGWRLAAAGAVHACGWAFWLWSRTAIGPLRLKRLPEEPPRVFRRDGPYGIVRHPLYLSYVMICAAPVVAGHLLLLPTLAAVVVTLGLRGRYEEARLRQQLGPPYDDYARQVKRLLPGVW
jgi:protein-S-isoprenylcysteine O-methyltransferase Ste14